MEDVVKLLFAAGEIKTSIPAGTQVQTRKPIENYNKN